MSGNRQKSTVKRPPEPPEEPMAPRVVAIPKEPVAANAQPKPPTKQDRIGDILRAARLEQKGDLYQIAEYLCIKPGFLIALENSRYDEFPADAYVIGFLRSYANFLGIDGKDAVDRYRYEMAGRRKKPVLAMPTPVSEGRAPSGIIMAGVTIALLLIYALWYGISSANRTEITTPPVLPAATSPTTGENGAATGAGLTAPMTTSMTSTALAATTPATTPSSTSSNAIPPANPGIIVTGTAPASKVETPPPSNINDKTPPAPVAAAKQEQPAPDSKQQVYGDASPSRVLIRATQNSWIMVTDETGKAIFDRVLKPGESYKVPNKPGLSLTTGNGNGITLSLDNNELPKVSTGAAHVVRNIPLDPEKLSQEAPAQ